MKSQWLSPAGWRSGAYLPCASSWAGSLGPCIAWTGSESTGWPSWGPWTIGSICGPGYKALFGLIVAILLAGYSSLLLAHTVDHVVFLAFPIPTHPIVTFPLLLFWFWSIPQAYNLIDGVNGLSMGLGLLILTAIGWHLGPQPTILKGALLAILLLNFPRAKHFLGDCGAMLMGTLFAVLTIRLLVPWNANLPLWIFAYPIMDVSLVVATRGWCGLPLGQADRSHLHHWMMDRMNQKVWLATPILLVFAALPMLRVTQACPESACFPGLGYAPSWRSVPRSSAMGSGRIEGPRKSLERSYQGGRHPL